MEKYYCIDIVTFIGFELLSDVLIKLNDNSYSLVEYHFYAFILATLVER